MRIICGIGLPRNLMPNLPEIMFSKCKNIFISNMAGLFRTRSLRLLMITYENIASCLGLFQTLDSLQIQAFSQKPSHITLLFNEKQFRFNNTTIHHRYEFVNRYYLIP